MPQHIGGRKPITLTGARMRETGRGRVQVPWPGDVTPDIDTTPEAMPVGAEPGAERCVRWEVWNPITQTCVPKPAKKERPLAGGPGLFERLRRMIVR